MRPLFTRLSLPPLTEYVLGPLYAWPSIPMHVKLESPVLTFKQPQASPISMSKPSSPREAITLDMLADEAFVLDEYMPTNTLVIRPLQKAPKRDWNKWAKTHNLTDSSIFRVKYKGVVTYLKGRWEDDRYFLLSERKAPIPSGLEAHAAKYGWGTPIKWDCPTHTVSLIKMSYGVPVNKRGRGPDAKPQELELRQPNGSYAPVYR